MRHLRTAARPAGPKIDALLAIVLLGAALASCQPAPTASPTPTPIPAAATKTPQPTAAPGTVFLLRNENTDSFVYYGSCFDLDSGVGTSGKDPDCDLNFQPLQDNEDGKIMLQPLEPAAFSSDYEFHTRPAPEDCTRAETLSSAARAVDPGAGSYLCYRTGAGHVGYFYILHSASNGVLLEWHTYQTLAQSQATATPTHLPVYASGAGTTLALDECISLDSGKTGAADETDCDLVLETADDGALQLAPVEETLLSPELLGDEPDRATCKDLLAPARPEAPSPAAALQESRYLCYRSREGRTGWLHLNAVDAEEATIQFDWLTLDPPEGDQQETGTPAPETGDQVYASENDRFIYFRSCYDLDDGIEFSEDDPACDFAVFQGAGGSERVIEFVPNDLSRFAFGDVFYHEPAAWECRRAATLSSAVLTANPFALDAAHICYQTDAGRYGVLQFEALGPDGMTIDWKTYDPPSTMPAAAPQPVVPTPENWPPGQPVWQDRFEDGENWLLYQDQGFSFSVEDDRLEMVAYIPESQDGWTTAWPRLVDFYLEGTFTSGFSCRGLDRYGLWFRASGSSKDSSGYLYGVSCSGHYMLRAFDGEDYRDLVPWTASGLIRPGPNQTHRLGVLAQGDRLTLYVDGVEVARLEDDAHQGANFGVFTGAAATLNLRMYVEYIAYWDVQ